MGKQTRTYCETMEFIASPDFDFFGGGGLKVSKLRRLFFGGGSH